MNFKIFTLTLVTILCVQESHAQVFDSGPSDSSLFDTVINLPADQLFISGTIGDTTGNANTTIQINVQEGGTVNAFSDVNSGSEVNMNGGDAGRFIEANASEFNINGGSIDIHFEANESMVNISGGSVGASFTADSGSEVNLSGGSIGEVFCAKGGSVINISDGTVGRSSDVFDDSVANITGGSIGELFTVGFGGVVNISGGTVGDGFNAFPGGEVNITGGTFGDFFEASDDSEVNISGGTIGDSFRAINGSEVNLFGTEFYLDNVQLTSLVPGQTFTVTNRGGEILSGTVNDGTAFSFELEPNITIDNSFFDFFSTLTVTLTAPIILGDVNLDGKVDFLDIAPFISLLSSGSFQDEADIDGSGVVTFLDIAPFIAILSGE